MAKKTQLPGSADGGDYPVGYGKPPKEKAFQKGRSGNPKGRPRGAPNFSGVLRKVMTEELSVTQGARQLTMTAFEAMIRKLRQEALAGKAKSVEILLALMREHCPELLAQEVKRTLAADDQLLIADYMTRISGSQENLETNEQLTRPETGAPSAEITP